ncbi:MULTISPECIES: hypothetical protein [unclassified Streptomyces]|uniref:hypothetical protein n=1 Tax=unclassified Streptomyces TaxID=2593676 RepID=UPI001D04C5B0|nr:MULTISPECIES: hypothetical protein [unclassified Streptomyces]
MARTAHHRARAHRRYDTALTTLHHDLRYSAAVLASAGHGGRRPFPQRVRRLVTVRTWARTVQDSSVARWSAGQERRGRQELRAGVRLLRALVNRPTGELDRDAADDVDVPPARHRRDALWRV